MNPVSGIGLSGLQTAALGVAASAGNVANSNTDGYKAKSIAQEDLAQGGVRPAAVRESQAPGPQSNVDLGTEAVNLDLQGASYQANLKVIGAQQKMLGTALDFQA